jgi:hypothetical protein
MPRKREPDIYVAKHGFACELDGERMIVNQGERVRAGHPLLKAQGQYFEPADTHITYDVEQATAAPGELRGA